MPGTLFVVATPIGNLEDITIRALRILREVALVAAEDTRRTARLLARHAIATPMTSLHEHNETRKAASIVARLEAGESIALVSDAGTPTVSDPGSRLIRAAIDAGISVQSIPGPSAVLTALAASGWSMESFTFLGFPPLRSKDRNNWFAKLRQLGGIVVFFEAPHRIRRTLEDLRRTVGNCEVVVGRELTKAHEELVRGPLDDALKSLKERGEFTILAKIGCSPEHNLPSQPSDDVLIGEITESGGLSKRQAVSTVARRHGLSPNDVYRRLENRNK